MQARGHVILATVVVVLWCAPISLARDPGEPAGGAEPRLRSDANYPDVYLNDSLEAVELFTKARRHASAERWSAAATLLEQAGTRYGDRLIQLGPGSYESVGERVRRELCRWPAAGLASYRRTADGPARQLLIESGRAKDLASLLIGFRRYFCSSSGYDLGDTAAQLAIQAGEFGVARRVYRLLAAQHPDREIHGSAVQARLAVVNALAGEWDAVEAYLAGEAAAGTVELPWLGARRDVRAVLEQIRTSYSLDLSGTFPSGWPVFGGSARRTRVAAFALDRMALLWRFDDFGDGSPSMVSLADRSYGRHRATDRRRLAGMNAVCADGLLVFQDAIRVWALRVENGQEDWVYGGLQEDTPQTVSDNSVAPWYAPTCADGRVYASMGSNLIPYYGHDTPDYRSSLVCLDALTGREIWRRDETNVSVEFAQVDYDGAPLVMGDRVFAIQRRRRAFGFEDCLLACFDAETGKVRFRTHLGSASTGGFGYRRPTMTIMAGEGDTIFVATNLGTVAAVDAHTGQVRWLRVYGRDASGDDWHMPAPENVPWRYNPVMVAGERIVCLPTDIQRVLVFEKDSGRIQQEIGAEEIGGVACLLGVRGGRLYGVGKEAFCYDLAAPGLKWRSVLPVGDHLSGRGLLTADDMLIPTERSLCAFDLASGSRVDQPWEQSAGGGNLLAVADRLVVTGVDAVSGYANKEKVWRRLRAAMAASPDAPEPALDLAEIAFRSGETNEALEVLAEAVARAGGFASIVDEGLKRRLFEDCLRFAEALREEGVVDAAVVRQRIRLYEYASQCPPDKRAHIRHRLPLAELYETIGRPERAVDLYQQILADDSLRQERYTGDGVDPDRPIGDFCRQRITSLMRTHGAGVYARYDEEAASLVQAGRSARDLSSLARVAAAYPNATAARLAHVYSGELLRDGGRPLAAARAFYHAYAAYPAPESGPDRASLLARTARMYEAAGRSEAALRWVDLALREHGDARIAVDGRPMTWAQFRDSLGHADWSVEPTVPRLSLPLLERRARDYSEPVALLAPPAEATPTTAWRHYYVYTEGGVTAHEAATGKPVWASPVPCRKQPVLLHAGRVRVVLATQHEVFACEAGSGRRLWEHGAYPAGLDDAGADPEEFVVTRYRAVRGDRAVGFRDDGRSTCLDVRDGRILWSQNLELVPTGPPAFGVELIAYPARQSGRVACLVLEADTGKTRCSFRLDEDLSIERMFVSPDDRVLVLTARALLAYDADTGKLLWRAAGAQPIVASSVYVDIDGVYLARDGRRLEKIRLSDGGTIWRSEALPGRGEDTVRTQVRGGQVLLTSDEVLSVLDARDGRTLFAPRIPSPTHLVAHFVTDRHLLALGVEMGEGGEQEPLVLRAFERHTGAAAVEGPVTLGRIDDFRTVILCDDALLIQDGRRILTWSSRQ